jgi:hypothetical protein
VIRFTDVGLKEKLNWIRYEKLREALCRSDEQM